jgi:hypothetical protein
VVIFGASGDRTARKLGPAVENLARHKRIPVEFGVVGVASTQMAPANFRSRMAGVEGSVMPALNEGFRYVAGGYDDPDTYRRLWETLDALDIERGTSGNRCFTSPRRRRRSGRRHRVHRRADAGRRVRRVGPVRPILVLNHRNRGRTCC